MGNQFHTALFRYRFADSGGEKWYIGFSGLAVPVWEARGLLPISIYDIRCRYHLATSGSAQADGVIIKPKCWATTGTS